jgi:hypothetical protein
MDVKNRDRLSNITLGKKCKIIIKNGVFFKSFVSHPTTFFPCLIQADEKLEILEWM